MQKKIYSIRKLPLLFLAFALVFAQSSICQKPGLYPQYTNWYQDPLGLKPLQLSTAVGFLWGSAAVAASLIFTKNDPAFREKISIYDEVGFSKGYKPPHTISFQNDYGVIVDVRKWMSVGLGWNAFHFRDKTDNTWTFGIRPFARWYPYQSKKFKLYFEYGAGLSYSLNRFPLTGTGWDADTARTGTKFNLTSKYGIGFVFHLNDRFSLQTSARHFHLSNGNIKGIEKNPSHDSNGIFAGIIYKLNNRTGRK